MTEVYILFGASVAVMFLAIVTLYVVVSYHKTLKRERKLEEEIKAMRAAGSEEARRVILNAQVQATEVIKNAQLKAQELINASEIFSKEYKQSFQTILERETNKMLSTMSQNINSQIDTEVKNLHGAFDKALTGALSKAQTQVEEYKKAVMERVGTAVFALIQSVAKKTLKESLSREQHEKLIIKALEEAKKQNVF
jgi:F0F1-type ATP synthase membrane subunit b/b'